jgi:hypothetical protein
MYRFHVAVHARPAGISAGPETEVAGVRCAPLLVEPTALGIPLAVRFEAAVDRLQRLPRMFVEPDGSFVWVSDDPACPWQVDGSLFDRHERLLYVELKGACPGDAFDRLLSAFGWPGTPLVFQLLRQAVFLDEASFRRFAEAS